jgi:predicted nucleic acid-binding protein
MVETDAVRSMDDKCALLDTSFCIRLLKEKDELHKNVRGFFQHFLEKEFRLKVSTISIAEYCVRGSVDQLPLKNLEVLPFNLNHAVRAGEFANLVFEKRKTLKLDNRLIIPNDTKLFAQAHVERQITHFATSDEECIKIYNFLKKSQTLNFEVINIRESYNSFLGTLPFEN